MNTLKIGNTKREIKYVLKRSMQYEQISVVNSFLVSFIYVGLCLLLEMHFCDKIIDAIPSNTWCILVFKLFHLSAHFKAMENIKQMGYSYEIFDGFCFHFVINYSKTDKTDILLPNRASLTFMKRY